MFQKRNTASSSVNLPLIQGLFLSSRQLHFSRLCLKMERKNPEIISEMKGV